MKNDPVLAKKTYTEDGETYSLTVNGGLNYLKANRSPYFSITASQYRKNKNGRWVDDCFGYGRWVDDCFGCCHDLIEKQFPNKFTDLIALHLSDMDGAPMHAAENAWYHAGGCGHNELTEAGLKRDQLERVCGDNILAVNAAMRELGLEKAALVKWVRYENTGKPEALANHLRINLQEATEICDGVIAGTYTKEKLTAYVEALRPRWKREAEQCIEQHGLVVYGDTWAEKKAG